MSNKRTLILLGAGASVEAGVPAAKQMAPKIHEQLLQYPLLAKAFDVAVAGLKFHKGVSGDPFGEIDIENVYELLRALAERQSSVLAPFVGAWSHQIEMAEVRDFGSVAAQVSRALAGDVDEQLREINRHLRNPSPHFYRSVNQGEFHRFESALARALQTVKTANTSNFALAASTVLRFLHHYCWIQDASKIEYLVRLVKTSGKTPLWIASLNYDNAIELAAKTAGIEVDIGIRPNESTIRFDEQAPVCLAKLHGSINWSKDDGGKIKVLDSAAPDAMVVFGSGNKLQIDGPYLDLLFAFCEALEAATDLNVCGYSFRDHHVNHLIVRWLFGSSGRRMFVASPSLTLQGIAASLSKHGTSGWQLNDEVLDGRIVVSAIIASNWVDSWMQDWS